MDDAEAIELIDAHLDRQPLTDEQSDALTAWIKADPKRADEAFFRIFLHSYLRFRLQDRNLPATSELSVLEGSDFDLPPGLLASTMATEVQRVPRRTRRFWGATGFILCGLVLGTLGMVGWWQIVGMPKFSRSGNDLYVYEGFDYPATILPEVHEKGEIKLPVTGGLQGLAGGIGWSEPWLETNSKVATIVDYSQKEMTWEPTDMRKFGPLGYTDSRGNVLQSSGNQMRTATSPRSISTRQLNIKSFPDSMKDGPALGHDGSVVWLSFLAQSSQSSAEKNRYSYFMIGSKSVAGLRIGKLGAAPTGNWTAVGLQTGAEVNLRSSTFPSGEMVFLVARIIFRPGPEDVAIWINPVLDAEPLLNEASLRLQVPDFRFDGISVNANHSTDFDEIRFGGTFRAVAPIR